MRGTADTTSASTRQADWGLLEDEELRRHGGEERGEDDAKEWIDHAQDEADRAPREASELVDRPY